MALKQGRSFNNFKSKIKYFKFFIRSNYYRFKANTLQMKKQEKQHKENIGLMLNKNLELINIKMEQFIKAIGKEG